MDYRATRATVDGVSIVKYHAIHRRPVGDVIDHSHGSLSMVEHWIETETIGRRERKAASIAKIEADDLSDYRSPISSLVGEERELKKKELIADINDYMADLHYDIVEEKITFTLVSQKVTTP